MKYKASLDSLNHLFNPKGDVKWFHSDGMMGYLKNTVGEWDYITYIPDWHVPSSTGIWETWSFPIHHDGNITFGPDDYGAVEKYVCTHEPATKTINYYAYMPKYVRDVLNDKDDAKELPVVIAICGESGCGKTSLALALQEKYDIPHLVSYTTRPMREGETNGKEHWFVSEDELAPEEDRLAYTYFGEHHYWTDINDLKDKKVVTYTIDERGIIDLYEMKKKGLIDFIFIYINRPYNPTDDERKDRDQIRAQYWYELKSRGIQPNIEITNDYSDVEEFIYEESKDIFMYVTSMHLLVLNHQEKKEKERTD